VLFSKVTGISSTASPSSSFFLKGDSLWVVGNDTAGQLGDGATSNRAAAKMVMTGVVKVASGQAHTLFLKSNGSVWVVGKNDDGQLGLGSRVNQSEPVQAVESDVVDIAAGDNSSYILRWGSVYVAGNNSLGQLGMDATAYGMPRFVGPASTGDLQGKVAKIFAGGTSASLITVDGGIYSVGDNRYGQLGIASADSNTSVWTSVAVSGAESISMTSTATFVVTKSGELLAAGKNSEDRFGVGDSALQRKSFSAIAAGVSQASASNTNLAYVAGGLLYGSGSNRSGQLGNGVLPKLGRMTQIAENVSEASVGANFITYLKQDGSLWGIGASESGQLGSTESSAQTRQIKF
jgi:alpha-tubulin suppressor-like RCC1 family protein